jgi:ankyrin repeat protein
MPRTWTTTGHHYMRHRRTDMQLHAVFARLLIQHGADVNAPDVDKSTPLHLASKGGHVEFAQVLIEYGADVNAEGNYKWTPLHLASRGDMWNSLGCSSNMVRM